MVEEVWNWDPASPITDGNGRICVSAVRMRPLSSSDVTSYLPEDTEDATLLTNLSKVVTEPAGGLCFLVRVCLIAMKLLDSGQRSKPAGLIN